ncbi:adenine deaminase [Halorubrum sp. Ea8]|uniref:adenine deaminase n=1 Tax=Halorubrum sp. Ea8 TaxID=1383841 RepID=UPI000B99B6E0|nr:adenine deaminase C-terminal domain-containing protein [Halorubrum sp. Ea8]OYR44781.1 adenosine deaminase [Halorubrum sp. Ea8]
MTDAVDTLVRGTVVNVNTGSLEDGAVAIDDGEIVALAERPAERTLDAGYVAPGLIDAHMHVESSMVTLPEYGNAVLPRGVTTVIHDPHEIANVLGEPGVRAVVEDAAYTPLKARFTVPSSVPASSLQDAGATLSAAAVDSLLDLNPVVALGEVMDIPGLLAGDEEVHAKIASARERGLTVDGHMPGVDGAALHEAARYLDTDHESITLSEARTRADLGIRVYLREGSSSKNLADLLPLTDAVDARRLSLCTDDREVVDIVDHGGVDFAVRKAIDKGADPVEVVQMATLNTAESYDLPFGRIAPGAPADLVLLDDLESWDVSHVMVDGELDPAASERTGVTNLATDTVQFDPVAGTDLAIEAPADAAETASVRVIDAVGGLQTEPMDATVPIDSGVLVPPEDEGIASLAVIERHGRGGGIGRGFVHGLGLHRGAIGSTVAHDAHNCVVAGADPDAMAIVANHLRDIDGGIAAFDPATDQTVSLALPVAGLMSDAPIETVYEEYERVEAFATDLGLVDSGLMELSFLALEVIPTYRLTNNGLVDVPSGEYVDVLRS